MFTEAAITRFPETHWVLLHRLEDVIQELRALNADPAPFPTTNDPLVHFNAYVDFGISTYAAKFFQFFESIEYAIENQIYLIYAQSGRALLENIATLRYYSLHPDLAAIHRT